ncbi:hypothetical protein PS682_02330 [Pseudomonas fluorescens]|nr:hypothetical protein PS682_02330 [Pseudomonas fluorescens]
MAGVRSSAIHIGALNLVLQPHTPLTYVTMLRKMARFKFEAQVHGDNALLLGSCRYLDPSNPLVGVRGEIYKFLKLDSTDAWFNTENMDEATEDEIAEINIPENLKPHFKKFQYIFFPNGHRFYFVSSKSGQSLSSGLVKRFFETVFSREEFSEFGTLNVTVQPDPNGLDELFSLQRISILKMEIDRPNPDDLEDVEAEILERLNRVNARREKIEFMEASNEGLRPDPYMRALAAVANDNGFVYAEGKGDDGLKKYLSTKNMPLHETAKYNPNLTSEFDALYDKVVEIHQEIIR